MDLQCEFVFPHNTEMNSATGNAQQGNGGQAKQITVGDLFYADCTAPQGMTTVGLQVKHEDPAQKYSIKLLDTKSEGNKALFKFTSYQVGEYHLPKLELQAVVNNQPEGEVYQLGAVNFSVGSILDPKEKHEAYGPFTGIQMPIPVLYWVILAVAMGLVVSSILAVFIRRLRRRKMLARLEEYEVSTTPLQEFYTTYRKIQREHSFFHSKTDLTESERKTVQAVIKDMESALKLYLLRKMKTPALEKNWSYTQSDLKKYHAEFMSYQAKELKEIVKEIVKANGAISKIKAKDIVQTFEKIRLFIEFSDNLQDAILKKDKAFLRKLRSLKI
ncbi:MAG: hypothetical protein KDD45_12840 [Bdellovibrionales bacterium]|nr:hypothetical protein [Bdellovibrionales bacterium]